MLENQIEIRGLLLCEVGLYHLVDLVQVGSCQFESFSFAELLARAVGVGVQLFGEGLLLDYLLLSLFDDLLHQYAVVVLLLYLYRLLFLLDRGFGAEWRFGWGISLFQGRRLREQKSKLLSFCSILDLVCRSPGQISRDKLPLIVVFEVALLQNLVFLPRPRVLLQIGVKVVSITLS